VQFVLAEYFGFEYSIAVKIFMVGFAALALLAALFIRLSFVQWIFAGTLFFNALTAPLNFERTSYLNTWMLPVQQLRAEGHLVLALLLTIVVVVTGRLHANKVPIQGLFLLGVGVYAGLLQFIHETPTAAAQSIGFALATIPCMLFAAPSVCNSYEGCLKVLRTIMLVSVAWTVCCSVQFVTNPKLLVNTGGRFWGMMGNAQGAALVCAPFVIIALWLMLHDPNRRLRALWVALIAINLLFVGWTGSRTGAVMLLLGAAFVLYNKLGKVILLLPFAAIMTFALSFLAAELQIGSNLERLVSSENTRDGVWKRQIEKIFESPIIGVGWAETGASESSYLAGFAAYGFVMFSLMVGLLLFSMWKCATLTLLRRRLPKEQRPLVDLFCSWNAMFFGAAVFEGFILPRSSSTTTIMLLFAGIGIWLTEQVSRNPHIALEDGVYEEEPVDDASWEAAATYGYDAGAPESSPALAELNQRTSVAQDQA